MSTTEERRSPATALEACLGGGLEPDGLGRAVLEIVVEQVAIRSDQLVRLVRIDADRVAAVLEELEDGGWLRRHRVFDGEAVWAAATKVGCGLFGVRPARWDLALLDHRYYINEVRVDLSERVPEGRWVAERFQRSRSVRGRGGEVPDGILELAGRRYAIEVELSVKPPTDLRRRVVEKSRSHDALVYYCGDRTYGKVATAVGELGLGNVSVRRLEFEPPRGRHPLPRASREPATRLEAAAARVVSEQGAVRVDHLAGLLSIPMEEAEDLADLCVCRGTLGRRPGLVGEADWLWPRWRAARIAGNGTRNCVRVTLGIFRRAAVVNECRIRAERSDPPGRWESERLYVLEEVVKGRRRHGREGSNPHGVFHGSDGRRTAYVVTFVGAGEPSTRRRICEFSRDFDRVVCVSRPSTCKALARFVSGRGVGNVEFQDLSGRSVGTGGAEDDAGARGRLVRGRVPGREEVGPLVCEVVGLVAEEGYLTRGDLGGLLGDSFAGLERAVTVGLATGVLREDWHDGAGRPVLAATTWGCRLAGGGLRAVNAPVRGRRIGRAEVLVQARKELWVGVSGAFWASTRMLAVGRRHREIPQYAVLGRGGVTVAVFVQVGVPWSQRGKVRARIEAALSRFDGVVVYCTSVTLPEMERLAVDEGWRRVELRRVSEEIERLMEKGG